MTEKKYDEKAVRAAVARKLRGQKNEFLQCRDLRHSWVITTDFHVVTPQDGDAATRLVRDLRCSRCRTERRDVFAPTRHGVEKIGAAYSYPEDYKIAGIPRGVKPQAMIRQEEYRRVLEAAKRKIQ
jgi:hypothetical protein